MTKNFETVVIFTPVLSEQEVKKSIEKYVDLLKEKGAEIIQEDYWGLKQLAYPIQKKTTGIYFVMEYRTDGTVLDHLEVMFRRDLEVLRFLSVRLDKYAIKYNDDKRNGLIGRKKKDEDKSSDSAETATETAAAANAPAPEIIPETSVPETAEKPAAPESAEPGESNENSEEATT